MHSLKAFGIELKPLEKSDLPLLCHWRNQPEIVPYMDVPREISQTSMAFWYAKAIRYGNVLPWLAYYNGMAVAYTEIKEIDIEKKSCVGGLFLFGKKYYGTGLSFRVVLCRELMMHKLGLDTLFSRVRKINQRSRDFCLQTGAELIGEKDGCYVYKYDPAERAQRLKIIAGIMHLAHEYETLFGKDQS